MTANITGFDFDDSMFNVIMMIAVNDRSQMLNYALRDADAPRSFGAVPHSEIMPIIKTSKRRVVECERHSQPGVSFSNQRQLSTMAILTGSNYTLPDLTAASVSGRRAQNVYALKT